MADSDPSPETGKLGMDKAGLQAFMDERVMPFLEALKKISVDDPVRGPALASLIGESDITTQEQFDDYGLLKPLAIGFMAQEDELGVVGKELNKAIQEAVESVTGVYTDQQALFEDILENLRTTITELTETQGANLAELDGRKFLEIFEDTVDDLSSSGSESGGGSSSGSSEGSGGGSEDA